MESFLLVRPHRDFDSLCQLAVGGQIIAAHNDIEPCPTPVNGTREVDLSSALNASRRPPHPGGLMDLGWL
jgi:hypothetical protein